MFLSASKPHLQYEIISLSMPQDSKRRFEILGMIPGSQIEVMNTKHSGARIIRLRGTRYAIGPAFSRAIEVKEV